MNILGNRDNSKGLDISEESVINNYKVIKKLNNINSFSIID
jgi:hypothetical protein